MGFGDSQIGQLDKSIKQVLSKHLHLDRYIVCIPIDLRDQRTGRGKSQLQRWQDWVAKWTAAAKKQKRTLSIELWGKSELVERLGRDSPLYSGRAAFWFDETILIPAWFQGKFEQARVGLGQRYTPETNVELPIRRTILGFCRDPSLLHEMQALGEKLEEARYDAMDCLKRLAPVADFSKEVAAIETATGALSSLLSATPADPNYVFPIVEITSRANDAIVATAQGARALYNLKPAPATHTDSIRYATHELRELEQALDTIIATLNGNRWRLVNTRRALITGAAGVGKSHLFGDAVDHQVHNDRPSILILGGTLIEDNPWTQIAKQLDLSISVEKFLGALDARARFGKLDSP